MREVEGCREWVDGQGTHACDWSGVGAGGGRARDGGGASRSPIRDPKGDSSLEGARDREEPAGEGIHTTRKRIGWTRSRK